MTDTTAVQIDQSAVTARGLLDSHREINISESEIDIDFSDK